MKKITLLTRIVIFCTLCNLSQSVQRLDEHDVLGARYFVGLSYDTAKFENNPFYNEYGFRQHDPFGVYVDASYLRQHKTTHSIPSELIVQYKDSQFREGL
ncbi:MAG: hypothetical protein FJX03_07930 [Alphaproteobacteria bacterium]|nr:hypothetical protein [Alphaproteobacteria bacterium]